MNAASLNVWPPTIKIALPFAAIVPIYVHCAQDLKHGAQYSANNCIHFVLPFAKHATTNAPSMLSIWNVAGYARKAANIVRSAVKTEASQIVNESPNFLFILILNFRVATISNITSFNQANCFAANHILYNRSLFVFQR